MYRLTKIKSISIEHFILTENDYHSHVWDVDITLLSEHLNDNNMIANSKDIDEIIDQFNFKKLNEIPPFDKIKPTAEKFAKVIADQCVLKWKYLDSVSVVITKNNNTKVEYSASLYDIEFLEDNI